MAEKLIKRGDIWYYRFTDANGKRRMRRGCSDKRETERMAARDALDAAKTRDDPKAARLGREAKRPIREHIDEFIGSMEVAGRNEQHISQTRLYVTRLCELARAERLADLTPSGMTAALGKLKGQGFATRTLQAHATAIKALSKWAWRDGRTTDYSLNALVKPGIDPSDRRRIRRPLSEAELRTLIETTRNAPTWRGVSGVDRSMLYLIASLTGFRRDELLSLTPASFRLDDCPPVAICESGYTKNGQRAEQPLPASCIPTLRVWLATKPARRSVFDGVPRPRTGMMLQRDLERADIPFETPDGVVDLHSLRHGYITTLARSGVPVKTLQTLARHADPRLTMNVYAHASLFDTSGAIEALPDLTRSPQTSQTNAATGTDGPVAPLRLSDPAAPDMPDALNPEGFGPTRKPTLAPSCIHFGDGPGRELPGTGVMKGSTSQTSMRRKPLEASGLGGVSREHPRSDGRVADGIRTRDIQIHNLVP